MSTSDYSRVAEAIGFLSRKAREQPALKEVADRAGLTEWHFQRVFQHWAGISPKRFLQFLTLGNAKQLLRDSTSIVEASQAVGLSSPARLHDLFVNLEGMTPGQFKRRSQGLTLVWAILPTGFGPALFAQLDGRLVALFFLDGEDDGPALTEMDRRWPEASRIEAPGRLEPHREALAFRLRAEACLPLAVMLRGTPFQFKVWEALLRIPDGKALNHQDLACLIPCHRVIRASGAFGFTPWNPEPEVEALADIAPSGTLVLEDWIRPVRRPPTSTRAPGNP